MTDIQKEFSYKPTVYTSEVLRDFLQRRKGRYAHFDKWLAELGQAYAYYSMRSHVRSMLKEKAAYLSGKDVKYSYIANIDGVTLTRLYVLFANSNSYTQLESIFYNFEKGFNKC